MYPKRRFAVNAKILIMTAAEYRTLREALGLSPPQVSAITGYALRTAQMWDEEKRKIPEKVEKLLLEIEEAVCAAVSGTVQAVKETAEEKGTPETVWMVRYRTDADLHRYRQDMLGLPASLHAAMLARIRRELFRMGIITRIAYMNPEEYEDWRKRAGWDDCEEARAGWASMQV